MARLDRLPFILVLAFVAVAIVAAACGTTTRFTPTNPSPRAMQPRHPQSVQMFTSSAPEAPFVEVGIIQARQSSELSFDDMPEIIQELRIRAAEIGCDGVIINGASDKVVGGGDHHGSSTTTLEGFWGACIMFSGA